MSFHFFSNSSLLLLNKLDSLSATFLVMYAEIFFTAPSACKYDLETFRGMSGESITPLRSVKNSGTIPSTLSVTKT